MGSGTSRLGSRPSRARPLDHRNSSRSWIFSSIICGGSSSRATLEMEDQPDEVLVNSAVHCDHIINEFQSPSEESSSGLGTGMGSTSSDSETGVSSISSVSEGSFVAHGLRNLEKSNRGKCMTASRELVVPYQVSDSYSHDESYRTRNTTEASTSIKGRQSSDTVSVNILANKDVVNDINNSETKAVSQISPRGIHSTSSSSQGLGDSHSDRTHDENHLGEASTILNSLSDSVAHRSDTPVSFHSSGDESMQDGISSDLGFLMPNREQGQQDGSLVHLDVVSISSSIFSGGNADTSSREARRNSRRLFWDAFSRRSSRRHVDSPAIFFSTDNTNDPASHDRWLLDFSGDFFDDGMGSDNGYLGSRGHRLNEHRRRSRSEIWERLRGGLDETGQRGGSCPSGLHPNGTCSCESFFMNEESTTRASISRIVMLAEALFEVLDEIHRQPVSLSLSMVSLPAPESVVDSFPLKSHKKDDKLEGNDEAEQCYICLAEYEEGDKIRVLPCQHEYHMSCVDKWLKEIHGVCPLCRGDVRRGGSDPSVSASVSEIPSG